MDIRHPHTIMPLDEITEGERHHFVELTEDEERLLKTMGPEQRDRWLKAKRSANDALRKTGEERVVSRPQTTREKQVAAGSRAAERVHKAFGNRHKRRGRL